MEGSLANKRYIVGRLGKVGFTQPILPTKQFKENFHFNAI